MFVQQPLATQGLLIAQWSQVVWLCCRREVGAVQLNNDILFYHLVTIFFLVTVWGSWWTESLHSRLGTCRSGQCTLQTRLLFYRAKSLQSADNNAIACQEVIIKTLAPLHKRNQDREESKQFSSEKTQDIAHTTLHTALCTSTQTSCSSWWQTCSCSCLSKRHLGQDDI